MDAFEPDVIWPIIGALVAGGAIGLEREFRARAAGFRTHVLVCVASAILMVCAAHQSEWISPFVDDDVIRIDPVRMAHGILTGIGFLCGGVIFREGLSVHGLFGPAILTVVLTLVVLTVFRVVDLHLPGQPMTEVLVRYRRAGAPTESEFLAFLGKLAVRNKHTTHRLTGAGEFLEFGTTIRVGSRSALESLAERLCEDSRVVEYVLTPRDG